MQCCMCFESGHAFSHAECCTGSLENLFCNKARLQPGRNRDGEGEGFSRAMAHRQKCAAAKHSSRTNVLCHDEDGDGNGSCTGAQCRVAC